MKKTVFPMILLLAGLLVLLCACAKNPPQPTPAPTAAPATAAPATVAPAPTETPATPDGRLAGFPLGDGSGPAQGREHSLLPQGPVAGAVGDVVAGIGAVDDEVKAVPLRRLPDGCHDDLFAEIAAVCGIGRDLWVTQRIGPKHRDLSPQLFGQAQGVPVFKRRLKRGLHIVDPEPFRPPEPRPQKEGRVRAPGKGQRNMRVFGKKFFQLHGR